MRCKKVKETKHPNKCAAASYWRKEGENPRGREKEGKALSFLLFSLGFCLGFSKRNTEA